MRDLSSLERQTLMMDARDGRRALYALMLRYELLGEVNRDLHAAELVELDTNINNTCANLVAKLSDTRIPAGCHDAGVKLSKEDAKEFVQELKDAAHTEAITNMAQLEPSDKEVLLQQKAPPSWEYYADPQFTAPSFYGSR